MKIKILVAGRTKEKAYLNKINKYKNWISNFSKFDIIYLKHNNSKKLSQSQIFHINKRNFSICLSESGNQISSFDFSNLITRKNEELLFIIGAPDGLNKEVIEKCDYNLSLSKFTLPHELAFLVLMEQIFRAISINNGSNYHRD